MCANVFVWVCVSVCMVCEWVSEWVSERERVCVCGSCVHGWVHVCVRANLFISVYMKVCVLGCVKLDKWIRDEEVGMKGGCGSCGDCMHGRGIICNHPVARITVTLTSTSPSRTALERGPVGILSTALHADIVEQKCYTRETCRFGNRTSMSLKPSALVSHQKRFVILLTYIQLGNHTRKHRVKQIRETFWLINRESKSKIRAAISTHQKCFADDYKCGLILLNLHCQSSNQNALACEPSFLFSFERCGCIATISGMHSNLPPRDTSSRLQSRELVGVHGSHCWQMLQNMPVI